MTLDTPYASIRRADERHAVPEEFLRDSVTPPARPLARAGAGVRLGETAEVRDVYGATLAWLLPKLQRARRTMWALGTVFAVTGLFDVGFIAVQAARGTYSRFNANTDTFHEVGQVLFSSGVVGLFGASLLIAVMLLFQRVGDAALTWSLRFGIGLSAIGMAPASFSRGWATTGPRTAEDAWWDSMGSGPRTATACRSPTGARRGRRCAASRWSAPTRHPFRVAGRGQTRRRSARDYPVNVDEDLDQELTFADTIQSLPCLAGS